MGMIDSTIAYINNCKPAMTKEPLRFCQNLIADTKAKLRAELASIKEELDAIARSYAGLAQPKFALA